MTPPLPILKVDFPVERNEDQELICLLCNREKCEWALTLKATGRQVRIGIHDICAARYAVRGNG